VSFCRRTYSLLLREFPSLYCASPEHSSPPITTSCLMDRARPLLVRFAVISSRFVVPQSRAPTRIYPITGLPVDALSTTWLVVHSAFFVRRAMFTLCRSLWRHISIVWLRPFSTPIIFSNFCSIHRADSTSIFLHSTS